MSGDKEAQGPWYEETGPSYEDVFKDLFNSTSNIITDDEQRKKIIEIVLPIGEKYEFGSWRGYATFLKSGYVDKIARKYGEIVSDTENTGKVGDG
jgi:hypothetical protein